MPLPAVGFGDLLQVTLYCSEGNQAALNVIHYEVTGVPTVGDLTYTAALTALDGLNIGLAMRACMASSAEYRGLTLQRLTPAATITFASVTDRGIGGIASQCLPRQTCGFIQKRPVMAGRRKGGRFYVPFPVEADNEAGGIPAAGYQALLVLLAAKLDTVITWGTGGQMTPRIYRRADPTHVPPIAALAMEISEHRPIQKWATQRRRGSFGATNPLPL